MRYTILIVAISLIFLGCKKNKTTKPELTFKSVNNSAVAYGDLLVMTLSFNNIQGNILDSLFINEVPSNIDTSCAQSRFSQSYGLPVFSSANNQGGIITVSFANGTIISGYPTIGANCTNSEDDTCHFQFVLQDQYGNKSDTLTSSQIIIQQSP